VVRSALYLAARTSVSCRTAEDPLLSPRSGPAEDSNKPRLSRIARRRVQTLCALLAVAVVAGVLFSRYSIDNGLSRDESAYVYEAQQRLEGVPFYVSLFEQKTPMAASIATLGIAGGRQVGIGDVHAVRIAFFVFAVLAVVAVYLLGSWLFESTLAGLLAAATFASFRGFALDALTGPDAKTPAVFFSVLAMALLVRRNYFWGSLVASLAFLTWQPLAVYIAIALAAAFLAGRGRERWQMLGRASVGAAIPLVVTAVAFALQHALDDLIDAAFVFPVTYLSRTDRSFDEAFLHIVDKVHQHYDTGLLFWGGLAFLLALAPIRARERGLNFVAFVKNDPYAHVVLASFVPLLAFSIHDFQGYPDVYPLLVYPALGVAGAWSYASQRLNSLGVGRAATVAGIVGVAALVVFSWAAYSTDDRRRTQGLIKQEADARALERLIDADDTVYVLGNPAHLVFLHRRNPSRYSYLQGGFDRWVVAHTAGGFAGWTQEIRATHPVVIIKSGWRSKLASAMRNWLDNNYTRVKVGRLRVYATPEFAERRRAGIG
jgi:4-amino-4-deoxy-L-arabinose transferase-like glycosyltransferase